jgi:hypothetical protein
VIVRTLFAAESSEADRNHREILLGIEAYVQKTQRPERGAKASRVSMQRQDARDRTSPNTPGPDSIC